MRLYCIKVTFISWMKCRIHVLDSIRLKFILFMLQNSFYVCYKKLWLCLTLSMHVIFIWLLFLSFQALGRRGLLDLLGMRKTVGTVDIWPPPRRILEETFCQKHRFEYFKLQNNISLSSYVVSEAVSEKDWHRFIGRNEKTKGGLKNDYFALTSANTQVWT